MEWPLWLFVVVLLNSYSCDFLADSPDSFVESESNQEDWSSFPGYSMHGRWHKPNGENNYKWWHAHHTHQRKAKQPEFLYADITPYRIFGKPPERVRKPRGCKAIQLYTVFRHGERDPQEDPRFNEPNLSRIGKILNPLIKRNTGIDPSVDIQFPWKSPYLEKEEGLQVPEGDRQIYNIARRFAKRFPELFSGKFSIADYNFTTSCFLRSSQSINAFGLGYLKGQGRVTKLNLQPFPIVTYPCPDKLHRPQSACPKWLKTIARNPKTYEASDKFLKSDRFQKIVQKVRDKLGLSDAKEIDEQVVRLLFLACGFGVQKFRGYEGTKECSLFSAEDQQVFDYYVDSYMYYLIGPGNKLNTDVSCFQLQDIIMHIQSMAGRIPGFSKQKVISRHGHGSTMYPIVNQLGLFMGDTPLLADNYEELRDREFKFGNVAPMSGNYAFVLYQCPYGKYKIQFYLNEKIVKLPACQNKDCDLDEFLSYYKPIAEKCDWDKFCNI